MTQIHVNVNDNLIQDDNYRIYNAKDAWVTQLIARRLSEELKEDNLFYHYTEVVQPLARVINRLNLKGLWVDEDKRVEAIKVFNEEAAELESQMADLAGRKINVRSRDFATFLFDELRVPCKKRNKDGSGSVTQALLEELSVGKIGANLDKGKLVAKLALQIRKKKTLVSTFLESAVVNPETGRVHSNYKIGPVTGRLACVARGSRVTVPGGYVAIEDVKVGDTVYCYDSENPETLTLRKVAWAGKTGHKQVVRVHYKSVGNGMPAFLDVTPEHRIRLVTGEYRQAKDLNYGDRVLSLSRCTGPGGYNHMIEFVEYLENSVDVYNLEVEEHHNYIVNEVCVKNSSKPAFLTIPKGIARDIYAAPPGKIFCYADWSQLELRILAILANDIPLLEAFAQSEDIHMNTARDLMGPTEWAKFDEKMQARVRFFAKMFIYAMNYGGSIETVMESGAEVFKNVSLEVMKAMERRYFAAHPAITAFRRQLKRTLYRDHKLVNIFGRPRIFFADPTKALRSAYNFPMQSSGADLMNKCMIELDKRIPNSIVLQVHDALVLEVDEDKGERTLEIMKEVLEAPVPELNNHIIPVDAKLGKRWGEF